MKRKVRVYKPTNFFQDGGQNTTPVSDQDLMGEMVKFLSQEGNPNVNLETAEQYIASMSDPMRAQNIRVQFEDWLEEQQGMNAAVQTGDEEAAEDYLTQDMVDEQEAQDELERKARYEEMLSQEEPDYSADDAFAQELINGTAKYGGSASKRQFANNVFKLVKKQFGGDEEEQQGYIADSTGADLRKEYNPKNYVSHLQNIANNANMKSDADMLAKFVYEQSEMDDTDPMMYDDSLEQAQFGGMRRGQQRRFNRRMNRMIGQIPMGFNSGMPGGLSFIQGFNTMPGMDYLPAYGNMANGIRMANIDVRKTGLFGRPKEYTITFAQEALTNPKVREDVINLEEANKKEEVKDVAQQEKSKEVNTKTDENKGVAETEATLPTENEITVVGKTPAGKKPTGKIPAGKKALPGEKAKPAAAAAPTSFGEWWNSPQALEAAKKASAAEIEKQKKINSLNPLERWYYENVHNTPNAPANNQVYIPNKNLQEITVKPRKEEGGITGYGLNHFVYGGNEDMPFTYADESFQTNSKNINDPYFRQGGLYRFAGEDDSETDSETNTNTTEEISTNRKKYDALKELGYNTGDYREGIDYSKVANSSRTKPKQTTTQYNQAGFPMYPAIFDKRGPGRQRPASTFFGGPRGISYAGSWLQQQGLPYDPVTGQIVSSMKNPQVSSIKVNKTGLLGRPKKYTINFMGEAEPFDTGTNQGQLYRGSDGQLRMSGAPSTQQRSGLFNTNDEKESRLESMYRRLTEKGFSTPEKDMGKGYDKYDENHKKRYGHYPGEGPQLDLKKELAFQVPPISEDEQYPAIPDLAQMQGYQLPTRKAMPLSSMTDTPEIIPSKYGPLNVPNFGPEVPFLEEGVPGPMGEEQALEEQEAAEAQRMYGLDLLDPIASMDDYMAQSADENQLAEQEFLLERMQMQNPNYFNESPYNNPVFNPEEMTTENIIDFNAPIVTPQQYTEAKMNPAQQAVVKSQQSSRRKSAPVTKKKNVIANVDERGNVQKPSKQTVTTIPSTKKQTQAQLEEERQRTKAEVEKRRKDYERYLEEGAPSSSKVPGASSEELYVNEQAIRQGTEQLKKQGQAFTKKYGVDKATAKMYKGLLENPRGNATLIESMRKTYPSLIYLEPMLRSGSLKLAYGGSLPQAQFGQTGTQPPVGYFKDPATGQYTNFAGEVWRPSYSQQFGENTQGLSDNPFAMAPNRINPITGEEAGVTMGSDGEYVNEGLLSSEEDKANFFRRMMSVDAKRKDMWNIDAPVLWNKYVKGVGNMGINAFNAINDRDTTANLYNQMMFGNNPVTSAYDQGNYLVNQSVGPDFNPTRTGFDYNIQDREAKKGGYLKEGGVTYMSAKQIKDFLANGGEIEFI